MTMGTTVIIKAVITDNRGVESATLYYRGLDEDRWSSKPMTFIGLDQYQATLTLNSTILYYIYAEDPSSNEATSPIYTLTVTPYTLKASTPTFQDLEGNPISSAGTGEVVVIVTDIENIGCRDEEMLYIVQVRDSEGRITYITFTLGVIPAHKTYRFGASWTPREKGRYTVEVFAWRSWRDPTPLSEKVTASITIS